jgi:hypothetical protein
VLVFVEVDGVGVRKSWWKSYHPQKKASGLMKKWWERHKSEASAAVTTILTIACRDCAPITISRTIVLRLQFHPCADW